LFCETGRQKTLGNLSAEEIHAQVAETVARHGQLKRVVVAGMGEPLLNLPALGEASRRILDERLADEITVTTSGIVPEMARLDALPLHLLSVSLHATTNEVRTRLSPTSRRHPLEEVIAAAAAYRERTGVPVIMNYLLFDGVNDSDADVARLIRLLSPHMFTVKLKEWNEIADTSLAMSSPDRYATFATQLRDAGFVALIDTSAGVDVGGGCGQLRSKARVPRLTVAG
jgi:23S rRNA (adenine2503-C2)-methyltransferase